MRTRLKLTIDYPGDPPKSKNNQKPYTTWGVNMISEYNIKYKGNNDHSSIKNLQATRKNWYMHNFVPHLYYHEPDFLLLDGIWYL